MKTLALLLLLSPFSFANNCYILDNEDSRATCEAQAAHRDALYQQNQNQLNAITLQNGQMAQTAELQDQSVQNQVLLRQVLLILQAQQGSR
jgi:hypothetical protein